MHGSSVFAPLLARRGGGHILNTASIGGFASDPGCAPYTTSKFAVVGYSEALRSYQIYRHALGSDPADDVLVYQEDDEEFSSYVWKLIRGFRITRTKLTTSR